MSTKPIKKPMVEKEPKVEVEIKKEPTMAEITAESKKMTSGDRVKYTPSQAFRLIFPNGCQLFLNGVLINLIFDGRTYNFTPKIRDFVDKELNKIASFESDKQEKFNDPNKFFKNIG